MRPHNIPMLRGLPVWVGVLLACGGAVAEGQEPARDGEAAAEPPPAPELPGAAPPAGVGSSPVSAVAPSEPGKLEPQPLPPASADPPDGAIAVAQAWPVALALDATHVYWANWGGYRDGGILRASKQGGLPELLVSSSSRPDSLLLDRGHVYFAERVSSTLSRVPLASGPVEPIVERVGDMGWVLSEQLVYFLGNTTEGIHAVGKQGGEIETVVPAVTTSGPLQLHGGYVYWREHYFASVPSFDGGAQRLWRAPVQGGAPELLVTEPHSVLTGLVVDDQAVYYGLAVNLPECGCEGGQLKVLAHGSTATQTFASVQGDYLGAIAVTPAHLYWSTASTIQRTSKDGAVTVTLASNLPSVSALAVDDEHVYFGTYEESGSIRRIAR